MKDSDSPGPSRLRRHHTRSRAGCDLCRQLHQRCDEGRPACAKCVKAAKDCVYSQRGPPLREQRRMKQLNVPGEQSPWDATASTPTLLQDPVGQSFDPFGSFSSSSMGMPLQSARLLRYFSDVSRDSLKDPRTQCLSKVICEPTGLRNSLLLGLIHFAQKNGGLSYFSETFLYHKVTSIRLINEGLHKAFSSPAAFCESLRQIATLAVVELFSSPDMSVADTHMQGLVTLLSRQPSEFPVTPECVLEAEFTRRYFILVAILMQCVKSRKALHLDDPVIASEQNREDVTVARGYSLAVLCRIPSFLCPWAWSEAPHPVDVYDTIALLRATTRYTEERRLTGEEEVEAEPRDSLLLLDQSEASVTYNSWIDCLDGHVSSLLDAGRPLRVASSWSGMHASTAAYENFITDRVSASFIMGPDLLFHVLSMITMDLEETRHHLEDEPAPLQQALWHWKACIGSFSIRAAQTQHEQQATNIPSTQKNRLRQHFDELVREASLALHLESWPAAFELLTQVAWPSYRYRRDEFEAVWNQITGRSE